MLSTMTVWRKHSCWRKSYSNKATLVLDWSRRFKNSSVVITNWLTVTNYPYLKWQCIFYLLHTPTRLLPTPTRLYPDLTMRITQRMLYKKQELLTLREVHGFTPGFLVRSVLLIFLFFCVCVVLCFFIIFCLFVCFSPMFCVSNVVSVWIVHSWLPILFAVTFNKHDLATQSLNATISSSIYLLIYRLPKLHEHFNLDMHRCITFLTWISPPSHKFIKDKF